MTDNNELCGSVLTFGNVEQIEKLRTMRKSKRKYDVDVNFSGTFNVTVEALNKDEAQEKAIEEFGNDMDKAQTLDIEDCHVNEI